ncbi:MAG: SDR family oxidoreductase [Pirellulales bacterium]|nr:SDR family oxidoreductase [Pirellulales bacterium]
MELPRRIVITGATRGLGRALAVGLAARGHVVLGCGRNRRAVDELARELGPPCRMDVVDVRDERQVREWAEALLQEGAPDLLVNNAAVVNRNAPLWKVPAEEFHLLVDVNICGVAHCIRYFVPAMVRRRRGVIVNLSSGWGRSTSPEVAPYCATKWAIEGLTRALAEELPQGMAAIPLNPGIIDTDMLRSCFGRQAANYPKPDAWAKKAIPFLLSLGAEHNGRPLTVPQ